MERFPGRKYFEKDINVKKKRKEEQQISRATREIHWFWKQLSSCFEYRFKISIRL